MARIPLTVVDTDQRKGTITIIVHEVGKISSKLAAMTLRHHIFSILGPLGVALSIEKKGTVVCVATGIGAAQILPMARAFKEAGNKVIGVIGAKTKKEILLEAQMRLACHKLVMATNDGSYERKGLATEILQEFMEKEAIHAVYAIGTVDMMEAVAAMTKEQNIPTTVYLNPMMVDCMGMCGSCRVKIGRDILLACTDGPVFNGHLVDFDDYKIRINAFKEELWHNPEFKHNPSTNEPKIFKRFLSGILSD